MTKFKEAEAFKDMLIEASSCMLSPHIEAVFSVFQIEHEPQSEWVSVDDELPPLGEKIMAPITLAYTGIVAPSLALGMMILDGKA